MVKVRKKEALIIEMHNLTIIPSVQHVSFSNFLSVRIFFAEDLLSFMATKVRHFVYFVLKLFLKLTVLQKKLRVNAG